MGAIDTVVIRHPMENLAKCSLRAVEARPETRGWLRFEVAEPGF